MGYYINPKDGLSKEQWLMVHGVPLSEPPADAADVYDLSLGEYLPVCLVDNGAFTAAGIAYDERELREFMNPDDKRPKKWFAVKKDLLKPFMEG